MLVTLYKSALCPRCYMARKYLYELAAKHPELKIEEIDILRSPGKARKAGITMIPALVVEGKTLSSIYLGRKTISEFLNTYL